MPVKRSILFGLAMALQFAAMVVESVAAQDAPVIWPGVNGKPARRFTLPAPELTIGTAAGPEPTRFAGVVGAARLSSGEIVIGDAGSNRILFFDAAGRYLRAAGRAGDGPGEYRLLRWLGACADGTIGAYDPAHTSITFVAPTGRVQGTLKTPAWVGFDTPLACLDSASLIMLFNQIRVRVTPGQHVAAPTAVVRIRGPLAVDTITSAGVQDYYVAKLLGASSDVPLGRSTLAAVGTSRVFVVAGGQATVAVYDTSGAKKGDFPIKLARQRVTRRDWDQARRSRLDAEPLARSRKPLSLVLAELDEPDDFPPVDQIRADSDDNLWIKTFDNYQTGIATWLIVSSAGSPRAVMAAPRGLRILEIRGGYLLGVMADADGTERVTLHRLASIH